MSLDHTARIGHREPADPLTRARRLLALLGVLAMAVSLLPLAAQAQEPPEPGEPPGEPGAVCPDDAPELEFSDRDAIPAAHAPNVRCAVALQIVTGFADGTYGPALAVRRDQMASFVARALGAAGVALPEPAADTFTDVDPGGPHAEHINRLAAAGIVQGGPENLTPDQYGPGLRTRRDQMASFLMRAAGYALHRDINHFHITEQWFTDVPATNAHFSSVNAAAAHGITGGVGQGLYAPGSETRRDQLASFVVRLLLFLDDPSRSPLPPPGASEVDLVLTPGSGWPGSLVTATLTGPAGRVDEVHISGPCVEERSQPPDEGRVEFLIDEGAATGTCTLTFVVSFNDATPNQTITRQLPIGTRPQANLTLARSSGGAGTRVDGTLTGDLDRVRRLGVSGACVDDQSDLPMTDGAFAFDIRPGAAAGACELLFTVTFVDGATLQSIPRSFQVQALAPAQVSVTTSPLPGRHVTGAVTGDLGRISQIAVAGSCIDDRGDLQQHANGVFDIALRSGAAPGRCPLTFTVSFTDGSSPATITRTYQVNATTNGPNLIRALAHPATDVVEYHFDRPVWIATPSQCRPYPEETGIRFSVIDNRADSRGRPGVRRHPTDLRLGSSPSTVVATFPSGVVASARLATIRYGAVAEAGGSRCSYPSNAALPGLGDGTTARPDLLEVTGDRSSNVVRYTFNLMVSSGTNQSNRYAQVYNSEIFLIDAHGQPSRPVDHGVSGCVARYMTKYVRDDTLEVTNCYTQAALQAAVLGATQPMPPRPPKPFPEDYQEVNTSGITPSHPEAAAPLEPL